MLGSFFIMCDYLERFTPDLMAVPLLGGFVKGGVCATAGWAIAWPFEVVKSKVQGKEGAEFKGRCVRFRVSRMRVQRAQGAGK